MQVQHQIPGTSAPMDMGMAGYLKRQVGIAIGVSLFILLMALLSSRFPIDGSDADPRAVGLTFCALGLSLAAVLMPYWAIELERPMASLPRRGLGIGTLIAGLIWAVILPAGMLLWPYVLAGGERPWQVDPTLSSHALGLAVVGLCLWTLVNIGVTVWFPLVTPGVSAAVKLLCGLLLLPSMFGPMWWGITLLDGSISRTEARIIGLAFLASLLTSQAGILLVQRARRTARPS